MPGPLTLAQQWRAQYPGAYDDFTDQELEARIVAKFPDRYKHVPLTPPDEAPVPQGRDATGDVPFLPDWANDAGKSWVAAGPSRVKEGLGDVMEGQFSRGASQVLRGALTTAVPMVAPMYARALAAAPAATLGATAAGGAGAVVGSESAESLAEFLGADEDQAVLAGDVGGLAGGYTGVRVSQAAQQMIGDLSGRYGPKVKQISERASSLAPNVPIWAKRAAVDRALRVAGVPGPLASRAAGLVVPNAPATVPSRAAGAGPVANQPSGAPAPVAAPASAPPVETPPATASGARTAAAASPAAPTPQIKTLPGETLTVAAADRTAGQMSPQAVRNDLALSARRMGTQLSEESFAAADDLVRTQGLSPAQAVSQVAQTPTAAAAPATPSPRLRATQDEAREYARLLSIGKTDQEAVEAILAQRQLIAKTGATSPAKARRRVATRQATGRWPSGTP
jgi:hypothetical protein